MKPSGVIGLAQGSINSSSLHPRAALLTEGRSEGE